MSLILLDRMWERVERSKSDSDTSYFHELMLLGEMAFKLAIVGLVATIGEDKDRLRYQADHRIVRADGLGAWLVVLDEILTGPPLQFMSSDALQEQRELTQRITSGGWQQKMVSALHQCLHHVDSETQPLGKHDGRRWFHFFVRLRNKTRGHGALRSSIMGNICPDLENSIKTFTQNFNSFNRQWAFLHRNLSGKYRVMTLGNGTSAFDYLKSERQKALENGVYVNIGEGCRVPLLKASVDLDDFYFPNGDFTDTRFECISYITGDKTFESSAPYLAPVGELPKSSTQGVGSLEIQGDSFSNLPPVLSDYISRPELEEELERVLTLNDQYPVVTLYGGGGIGKTSLALRVAHSLTHADAYTLLVWFSARDIDLLPYGPKVVKPRVLSIPDIAKKFFELINGLESPQKKSREFIEAHLGKPLLGPALFIFDNFETMTQPLEVFTWLNTFIRLPNKILITTRHREFKGDYPIRVAGMKEFELDQLIDRTASRLGIHDLLTPAYKTDVKTESGGHPYVAKMLLGAVARNRSRTKVERIIASSDEILAALFERTYTKLSPAAQRTFLTVCGWRSNIPIVAVEAVLLQSSEERFDVREAIEELEDYSFIEVLKSERDEEEFIFVPFVASTFGEKKVSVHPSKIRICSDLELLQQFGGAQLSDVRHGIAPRISRLMKFVAREIEKNPVALARYLPMIELIARRHSRTWLLLSELHVDQGSLEEAKQSLRRFLETAMGNDALDAWRRLAQLSRESNDALGEIHALLKVCENRDVPFHEISNAANRLNNVFSGGDRRIDSDEKRDVFDPLAAIMASRIDEASPTDFSRLAWLHLNLHNEVDAKKYTRMGLAKDINNSYCVNLAIRLRMN